MAPSYAQRRATSEIYTLSLHDALPISSGAPPASASASRLSRWRRVRPDVRIRSEEHTSELQSHSDLVCRLLLEKKKIEAPVHRRQHDADAALAVAEILLPPHDRVGGGR